METVFLVLTLISVASATGIAARFLPSLPVPLVQIAFGALLALPSIIAPEWGLGLHVDLEPDLFILLFIAPLLFADARRFPQRELMALRGPILALALGLVLVTVPAIGYMIHWVIPGIPLPIAMALAAVLSPTDAVAVSAISGRLPVPPRLMRVLEGESLMNDASGLVAFKFAMLAAATGAFSFSRAMLAFIEIAIGGLLIGGISAFAFSFIRTRLIDRRSGEESATQIVLLQLLLPFATFLLAEHLHLSGILAAVASGLVINRTDLKRESQVRVRLKTRSMWEIIEYVLNSLVFLLLGFQLPHIFTKAMETTVDSSNPFSITLVISYVLMITAALLGLRFVWIIMAAKSSSLVARVRGNMVQKISLRLIGVSTIAGIRGTITLAAALSFPIWMTKTQQLPYRDLLIFIAAGVILCTLLIASVGMPILLRNLEIPSDERMRQEERQARQMAAKAAIQCIEQVRQQRMDELSTLSGDSNDPHVNDWLLAFTDVSTQLLSDYQERIAVEDDRANTPHHELMLDIERQLRVDALHAERREIYRLRSRHRINDELLHRLVSEIDLAETALMTSMGVQNGHG